jgi:hypothetical protein
MSKVCKAGIKYADVRVDNIVGPYSFPCLKQGGECSCAQFRTDEEVKAKVAEIDGECVKALVAMASVKSHIGETNEQTGKVLCQCGGYLHYAVAQINGHVWAKCDSCSIAFNE